MTQFEETWASYPHQPTSGRHLGTGIHKVVNSLSTIVPAPGKINFSLLQIFRGWAAVLVVLVHSSGIAAVQHQRPFLGSFFAMGNAGVDFFFVLSGFLVCYIHRKDFGKPQKLRSYIIKRTVRIYPIYWIVTLLILPVYFIFTRYGQGHETLPSVIVGSLLLLPMEGSPILVAGWSLRHEMLFYLWIALLIGLKPRWAWPMIGIWIAGMFISLVLSFGTAYRFTNPVMHLLWWPQNFEFILGCGAALVLQAMPQQAIARGLTATLLLGSLLAFLATGFFPGPIFDLDRSEHVLLYGSISFLIILTAARIDLFGGLNSTLTQSPPYRISCYVGDASYSIYLIHGPMISVLYKIAGSRGLMNGSINSLITPLIVLLVVVSGCVCHAWIEKPLLKFLRSSFSRPQLSS